MLPVLLEAVVVELAEVVVIERLVCDTEVLEVPEDPDVVEAVVVEAVVVDIVVVVVLVFVVGVALSVLEEDEEVAVMVVQ